MKNIKSDIIFIGKILKNHRKEKDESAIKCKLRNLRTLGKEYFKAYKEELVFKMQLARYND